MTTMIALCQFLDNADSLYNFLEYLSNPISAIQCCELVSLISILLLQRRLTHPQPQERALCPSSEQNLRKPAMLLP